MPRYDANGSDSAKPLEWLAGLMFSMKFGLVLLVIITMVSIIGTLLPSPGGGVSQLQHAQDVIYYTWWFEALLMLMAVNMLLATWRNVTRKVLPSMGPLVVKSPLYYENTEPAETLTGCKTEQVDAAFRQAGYRVARDGAYATAARGLINRWGAPVAHVGMAIVLLGGFASRWTSREGAVQLLEGGHTDQMTLMSGDTQRDVPLGFTIVCDDFDTAFFPKTNIRSHYVSTVTIEEPGQPPRTGKVEVNRSMVAGGWKLHQTSYQEVPGAKRYRLAVSGPALATTATLELSPGQALAVPGAPGYALTLGAEPTLNWALSKDSQTVQQGSLNAGVKLQVRADQFEPDFYIGADRKAASRSQDLNNPALHVTLLQGGNEIDSQWLFARDDMKAMMHGGKSNYELELTGVDGPPESRIFHLDIRDQTTGLSIGHADLAVGNTIEVGTAAPAPEDVQQGPWHVKLTETVPLYSTTITLTRNAAVPVVYFGSLLIFIGLMLAFFIQRREVFMRQVADGGPIRLIGVYRQAQSQFDPATRAVITRLKEQAHAPHPGRTESSHS